MEHVNEFCKELLKEFPYVSKERAEKMYISFSNKHETLEEFNEEIKTHILEEYPEAKYLKEEDQFGRFMDSNLCQFDEYRIHLSHFFNDIGLCVKKEDSYPQCREQAIGTFEKNTFSFIKTFN